MSNTHSKVEIKKKINVLTVTDFFEIKNGLLGIDRDVFVKLIRVMHFDEDIKVRSVCFC
jgi:hypothetical protein